jgi:monoamine oxidase
VPTRHSAEVVIIGAGAAGLAAGRTLAASGKRVIIVEARERIGGRILTHHTGPSADHADVAVELGAEFVHGLPPVSWSLIREAQLSSIELQGKPFCFDDRKLEACDARQRAAFSVLEGLKTWIEQRAPAADLSFEEYLRAAAVESAVAERAAAYVEGFNAADRNLVSAQALVRQQRAEDSVQGDRIFHVRSGYDALPGYLAEQLTRAGATLLLGSPVREIHWTKGAVSVRGRTADGGEFHVEAPQAVVTLPLGVLQENSVMFDPVPGEISRHWNSLIMGQAQRISLLFDRRFWDEKAPRLGFLFAPGEIIPTWWTSAPQATPLITGWAAGATTMARWHHAGISGLAALKSAALHTLGNLFGVAEASLRRWLVSAHHHDWQSDEFSRGAYSYVGVAGLKAARIMSTPLDNTLFFAGEHTDVEDQWGTVHAALASGVRAAGQVLQHPPRRS